MAERSTNEDDRLADFEARAVTLDGVTKVVHVAGARGQGDAALLQRRLDLNRIAAERA